MNQANRFHNNIGNFTFGWNANENEMEKVYEMIIHASEFEIYPVLHIWKAWFCDPHQIQYKASGVKTKLDHE